MRARGGLPRHVIGYENTFVHAMADFLKAVEKNETIEPNFHDGEKDYPYA